MTDAKFNRGLQAYQDRRLREYTDAEETTQSVVVKLAMLAKLTREVVIEIPANADPEDYLEQAFEHAECDPDEWRLTEEEDFKPQKHKVLKDDPMAVPDFCFLPEPDYDDYDGYEGY